MGENLIEKTFFVRGMSCSACELRIEGRLKTLRGVQKTTASFSKATVSVVFDKYMVRPEDIIRAMAEVGYDASDKPGTKAKSKAPAGGRGKTDSSGQLTGLLLAMLAGYMLIKHTIGFDFIPEVDQGMGYGLLFVVGLMTSIHCLAMCGGINLSQSVGYRTDGVALSPAKRLKPALLYNAGRVLSYTAVGGTVGAIGSVVSFSGAAKGAVAMISGAFMLIMGLNMLNAFPWLRGFNIRLPKALGRKIHGGQSRHGAFVVGLINGFMPCGPLQAMQLYALGTGGFFPGALSMLVFSLGTVPLMFLFGAVSSFLSSKFTGRMLKASGALIIFLGLLMLSRGLSLSGIQLGSAGAPVNIARVENNVQKITTSFTSGGYARITVQKGIPVRWTIRVTDRDLNGCNNPIVIPRYNLRLKLVPGDNIVEFTPEDTGTIPYSCWMGMIRSTITVVEDVNSLTD